MIVSNSVLNVGNEILKKTSKSKGISQKNNEKSTNINTTKEKENWKTSMALDLEQYYKFLKSVKKCSNNTLESYQRDLRQFQNYVLEKKVSYLKYNENDILDYLEELKKIGKSDATRARILASIKGFYMFLVSNKKMKNNSILTMQTVKVEKKKVIENDLIAQENKEKYILNMKFEDSPKGIRDKAILEMTYNTNLKATQLISLKLNDYDAKSQTIRFENRIITLTDSICEAISNYLHHSRETLVMYRDVQELFVNAQGSKMTRQGYWKIVKSYEEQYEANKETLGTISSINKKDNNEINILKNRDNEENHEFKINKETVRKKDNYGIVQNVAAKNNEIISNRTVTDKSVAVDVTTPNDMVSDFILRCMNNGKKED